jgi:hypothetical protein
MQNPSRPGGGDQLARVNRRGGFGGSVGAEATASRLSAPITEVITAGGASPTLITTPSGCQHAPQDAACPSPPTCRDRPRRTSDHGRGRETWANRTGLGPPMVGIPRWELQGRIAMRGIS